MFRLIRPSFLALAILTLLTGVAYPLLVTAIAQGLFPHQANGSLIVDGDQVVGSQLIGQTFANPGDFWSRPSATSPPYHAGASSGSNRGPLHPDLHALVRERVAALKAADPDNAAPIPVDLVTTSASGLDPHISPAAAEYQAGRVARARGVPIERIRKLIEEHQEGRALGVLGEQVVNVVLLNRALDSMAATGR